MEQARQRLEAQFLERAAKDFQFREQLKQDPRGTVVRDFGVQVPADTTVEVLEETPSKLYLVLPPSPVQQEQELTGQELEAVAGGWSVGIATAGSGTPVVKGTRVTPANLPRPSQKPSTGRLGF